MFLKALDVKINRNALTGNSRALYKSRTVIDVHVEESFKKAFYERSFSFKALDVENS